MKKAVIAVIAVVVVGLGAVFAYAWWSDDNAPEELSLSDRPDPTEPPADDVSTPESVDGEWTVSDGSEAGYRVVEDFVGGIANAEAVGRTNQVTGSLTIDGPTVTSTTFEVDMASVESDQSRRDDQFRGRIMSVDEFPTATFELSEPIELGEIPGEGEEVEVSAAGSLTLRGETNDVDVTVSARFDGAEIAVAGEIPVVFDDYGIPNPSNSFVSTRDHGTVEFLLVFVPAA